MRQTPTLQMLWETSDPCDVLFTRFGHRDAEAAACWVTSTLDAHWGLRVERCERIVMSSHNALAWVATPTGPMVVKWSVDAARFERLEALADLTAWLAQRGHPVSPPVAALDGRLQLGVDGVSVSVQRQISGEHLDVNESGQVREAGVVLGRLHDALATYEGRIPDLTCPAAALSQQVGDWLETSPEHLPAEALNGLRRLVSETVAGDLPTQLVHGDYRSANLFVDGAHIVAVIDFEEARIDHRIVELARSAVLLGTQFHDWGPVPAHVHATLLDGYRSDRQLTPSEASWWKPLLLWNSLTMAPLAGDPAGWIASGLSQLQSYGVD